mgnify:FL=1
MPVPLANGLGVASLIIVMIVFYFVNIKPINASVTLIKAISPNQQTGAKGSLELFKKVLNAKTFVSGEAREQLASMALGVIGSDQYDDNFKKEFFTLAVMELETQAKKIPGDARSRVFLGNMLRSTGNLDLATQIFKEAVTASPNKQTILFQLGETYLSAGKIKEGIEVFKTAFELEPKFEEARKYYALSLILAKEIKQSDALLMEGFGTTTIKDSNFIRAYNLVGLPARAKLLDN